MPKGSHIHRMRKFCGCACFFFNKTLAHQKNLYEENKASKFSHARLAYFLPILKKNSPSCDIVSRIPFT
jgi:hypothetical protein